MDQAIGKMLKIITARSGKEYPNIKMFKGNKIDPDENAIYVLFNKSRIFNGIRGTALNYSLHESYEGIKDLILKVRAKKTLIAHYSEEKKEISTLLEDLHKAGYDSCEYIENEKIYEF